ncbi:hypothetical protein BH09VER1_BH09VER1_29580 [soil metagenome]
MDKESRNLIQRATQDARRLLEHEYREQLEGLYDVLPDTGKIAEVPGAHLDADGRFTRTRIVAAIAHERSKLASDMEAIAAYLREAAFTTLNRFAALKLMEARRIVQECVSKGNESAGFREFSGLAPGLGDLPDRGYRLYLECLFDEAGVEVGALFDRRHPSGLLWPRRPALLELLEILNRPGLAGIWSEDETIGWIYQHFNSKEERDVMRDTKNGGSSAPRNSRELAVRNQFFTPRYVVQFLTDNTLGRLWYEMRGGQTRITELCKYLIVSSDEHRFDRPIKDPRDLKIIDPACGSMHFGLYAFDVLTAIYLETWNDLPDSDLRLDYPEIALLQRDLPKLMIERNIHGIDIDPRATQIAGFALWLRAQRAWTEQNISSSARPRIEKSNIVCAEPMAGGPEDIREFVDSSFAARREKPAFQLLLARIQEAMKLAGEAGSLLKIEDDILASIAEAKKLAREGPTMKQSDFLASAPSVAAQAEILLDLSGLTDEEFWDRAEHELLDALSAYSESVTKELHGRLFAQDAARGIGFIHLCREKYDVALMNPPFGDASIPSKPYIDDTYGDTKGDVYKAFVECFQSRLVLGGYLGIISSRTGFFLGQSEDWRTRVVLRLFRPIALADLGSGVLDAMVEVAAYVLRSLSEREARDLTLSLVPVLERVVCDRQDRFSLPKWQAARGDLKRHQAVAELEHLEAHGFIQRCPGNVVRYTPLWREVKRITAPQPAAYPPLVCLSALRDDKKADTLLDAIHSPTNSRRFLCYPNSFSLIPGAPFAYWVSDKIRNIFRQLPAFDRDGRTVKQGLATADDFRFMRAWCEVPACETQPGRRWPLVAKGGVGTPFYTDFFLSVNWANNGNELKAFASAYRMSHGWGDQWTAMLNSTEYYFRPGLTYPLRSARFSPQVMPEGIVISVRGSGIYIDKNPAAHLALMASRLFDFILKLMLGTHGQPQFDMGDLNSMPTPELDESSARALDGLATTAWRMNRDICAPEFISHAFLVPALLVVRGDTLAERAAAWTARVRKREETINAIQAEIDDRTFHLYGLNAADCVGLAVNLATEAEVGEVEDEEVVTTDMPALVADLLEYALGCGFGRWDIRFATAERNAPEPPDPFTPLPVCSPGMLQNASGLPAEEGDVPDGYPLRITWPGILVDDSGNPEDIETRIRECLTVGWGDRAEAIGAEACQILRLPLREYFRKEFFTNHLGRYARSKRKAPIYWPLSTASGSYTIWLYYQRFTKDTFYRVREIADEKFRHEERKLFTLQQDAAPNPSTGQSKEIGVQAKFVDELREFRAEIARVASLWNPNLNDGVIINFAPFHRLISHAKWRSDVSACWETLVSGKYDWAHLAMHLWPERVIPKCVTDRSLAIAHGLDETFWEPDSEKEGRFRPKTVAESEIKRLIAGRTSPAVKAALESLATQPTRAPARKRRTS